MSCQVDAMARTRNVVLPWPSHENAMGMDPLAMTVREGSWRAIAIACPWIVMAFPLQIMARDMTHHATAVIRPETSRT